MDKETDFYLKYIFPSIACVEIPHNALVEIVEKQRADKAQQDNTAVPDTI